MLQFRYPDGILPDKLFHLGSLVIAVLKPDDFGRRTPLFGEIEEVRIGCHNDKPVAPRIFPNRFVRSEPGKPSVEDVGRIGEELGKAVDQLRREIRVKKKPQRERRSLPACAA